MPSRKTKTTKDEEEEKDEDEEETTDEDTDTEDSEDESDEEESEVADEAGDKPVNSVSFKLHNPNVPEKHSTRTFSRATHGDGFMELADSFEAANTRKVPKSLQDKEEVDAVLAFNRDIKHHILQKHTA